MGGLEERYNLAFIKSDSETGKPVEIKVRGMDDKLTSILELLSGGKIE